MVATGPRALRLGADDVPEMLDLAGRTDRGPFLPRTIAGRRISRVARACRDTPFPHVVAEKTGAIRLYESIGFTLRRPITIHFLRVPGPGLPPARVCG